MTLLESFEVAHLVAWSHRFSCAVCGALEGWRFVGGLLGEGFLWCFFLNLLDLVDFLTEDSFESFGKQPIRNNIC